MNIFYLVVPIGLEEALIKEIRLKKLEKKFNKICLLKGGIEVECPLETGLSLNYLLKCPTRVLLRLKERKCRDYPKLFKTIGQIDWKDYLNQEKAEWRISTSKSRLINTDKAKDACEKALEKYFKGSPLSKKAKERGEGLPSQKVFLRIHEDVLTISLDTSGDLLHIRGGSPDRGKASLRANYAACLLMELFDFAPKASSLIDPMCGTGTFLSEALDICKLNNNRFFPFETWKIQLEADPAALPCEGVIQTAIGLDLDPKPPAREDLKVLKHDIFRPFPDLIKENADDALLVCNFPYGKRVKIKGNRTKYFKELIKIIETQIRPKAYGVIVPADINLKFDKTLAFNNNGIKVNFCMKRIRG